MAIKELVEKYTEEFLEKIFYFCLKKCSNPTQAEDLASEINCSVLNALDRDFIPRNFYAWVWAVARNQYSKWVAQIYKQHDYVFANDIGEYEIADEESFEDNITNAEHLNILRRELAFVAQEYREIIIAYYIEGRKTEEIARSLQIPKGTVVSKLYRIRKKLREGFEMSREFGVLSYKPENVGFIMNGQDGTDGSPKCFFSRMISKNIILAAYRNPMTAEELAIEMGISLPYMVDELSTLVNATLLKKNGDKFETAIFIVSATAQERCISHMTSIASELTSIAIKSIEYRKKCYEQNSVRWHEGYQSYEDMKWAILMRRVDEIYFNVIRNHKPQKQYTNTGYKGHTIRPNNGRWDLLGLETCNMERPPFIGQHGNGETPDRSNSGYNYQFSQYKFQYENIADMTPNQLSDIQGRALVDCARHKSTNSPTSILEELVETGHLKKIGGEYLPTFWVQFCDQIGEENVYYSDALSLLTTEQITEYQRLSTTAINLLDSLYNVCREAITQEIPVFLRDDEHQISHAIANMISPRGSVFKEAVDMGWIAYDASDIDSRKHRMLGTHIVIG